jgi:hypothetical protein
MRDRKRVYDNKNIGRLETEVVNFFKDNIARFGGNPTPAAQPVIKNPEMTEEEKIKHKEEKKRLKKQKKREAKLLEKQKNGKCCNENKDEKDIEIIDNHWSIKI